MPDPDPDLLILREKALDTPFAEAYRTLRANLSFSTLDQPAKTIAVTSAYAGEGKTTVAVNLGIILAQAGPRVVIVDADFRRPSIERATAPIQVGEEVPGLGLSSAMVGSAEIADVLRRTVFDGVRLVPTGLVPPNPGELLGSQRMQAVLDQLAGMADYVIIDTPPCLLYADALLLARMVDGVLYVVRAGSQNKAAQRRVQKALQQAKARVLGVVFNDAQTPEGASSYGYYGYEGDRGRPRTRFLAALRAVIEEPAREEERQRRPSGQAEPDPADASAAGGPEPEAEVVEMATSIPLEGGSPGAPDGADPMGAGRPNGAAAGGGPKVSPDKPASVSPGSRAD